MIFTLLWVTVCSECVGQELDVIFVVDSSSSISADNFEKVRQFLISVISALDTESTRVGLLQFTDFANKEFGLGEITNKNEIVDKVTAMAQEGGNTHTNLALDMARQWFVDGYVWTDSYTLPLYQNINRKNVVLNLVMFGWYRLM